MAPTPPSHHLLPDTVRTQSDILAAMSAIGLGFNYAAPVRFAPLTAPYSIIPGSVKEIAGTNVISINATKIAR